MFVEACLRDQSVKSAKSQQYISPENVVKFDLAEDHLSQNQFLSAVESLNDFQSGSSLARENRTEKFSIGQNEEF